MVDFKKLLKKENCICSMCGTKVSEEDFIKDEVMCKSCYSINYGDKTYLQNVQSMNLIPLANVERIKKQIQKSCEKPPYEPRHNTIEDLACKIYLWEQETIPFSEHMLRQIPFEDLRPEKIFELRHIAAKILKEYKPKTKLEMIKDGT